LEPPPRDTYQHPDGQHILVAAPPRLHERQMADTDAPASHAPNYGIPPGESTARLAAQHVDPVRLSATVTPKFSPYITFPPIFPPIFYLPQRFPLNIPPIPHYHYKLSFSIPTINFLSTNNYSWTHSTVFRVMNSDTLDLGGERMRPTRRGRCRGHRYGHRVPPTTDMQGEGEP
jgi:hypothetical protein